MEGLTHWRGCPVPSFPHKEAAEDPCCCLEFGCTQRQQDHNNHASKYEGNCCKDGEMPDVLCWHELTNPAANRQTAHETIMISYPSMHTLYLIGCHSYRPVRGSSPRNYRSTLCWVLDICNSASSWGDASRNFPVLRVPGYTCSVQVRCCSILAAGPVQGWKVSQV